MSDFADVPGRVPASFRWNAEIGVPGRSVWDPESGERSVAEIELNSREARFAVDFHNRRRGVGLIRTGFFDVRTTPVGQPCPEAPSAEYKPAASLDMWSPDFDELRWETTQAVVINVLDGLFEHIKSFKEASDGWIPIILFEDRIPIHFTKLGKTFFAPKIRTVTFVERSKTAFAGREAMVKLPPPRDSQISIKMLESKTPPPRSELQERLDQKLASKQPPIEEKKAEPRHAGKKKPRTTGDFIDDEIPPFDA